MELLSLRVIGRPLARKWVKEEKRAPDLGNRNWLTSLNLVRERTSCYPISPLSLCSFMKLQTVNTMVTFVNLPTSASELTILYFGSTVPSKLKERPDYRMVVFACILMLLLLLLLSRFSRVWLCATPKTAVHQAPLSLGFSRLECWSGLPFPSPMRESEKWKWSHSVVSDSLWPHGL